jgi:hypothetical protein
MLLESLINIWHNQRYAEIKNKNITHNEQSHANSSENLDEIDGILKDTSYQ